MKRRVPELAMLPMVSITSWRPSPMPLSEIVRVPASRSIVTRIRSSLSPS